MRLPHDLPDDDLVTLLWHYGYAPDRESGSHRRLTSTLGEAQHHLTVPRHAPLRVGTLSAIVTDVAAFLDRDRVEFSEDLFGR